ncbi:MAG: carboxypeptidase-like regulatory domain-containing protein [Lutibacter sp.]|uniref:TonB-dependent receptor n=1 Tax=Lutibacter sp. TaxID=1925666 RepID=UPI001A105BCF|nr:TonB-dependent receptor [Lutibacter sp.]NOR29337.1 carboxypeptidase-like regulatory domain-containing protein [Lutibacter sp.]
MLKKLALGLVLFSMFGLKAQIIVIKGTVKDSLQKPLTYANVIAKPQNSAINLSFAITDEQGRYKLTLTKNETYTIEASFLGYTKQGFKINSIKSATKDFILKQASQQLNEVVIIQQLPVEVKEDTITYRTKAFITGNERKLKAVLNKLPGVEVDKNGLVTVQGKQVTHMLVEGKKFFGGNSKLAIENIPADAVGEVDVIDNYNEVAMLKGVTETDDMAMNIKLKKDKKKFAFGDVEVGKGNKNYYLAHTGLFYYSPKTTINFIGDINTLGDHFFTMKDYLRFEGGINKVLRTNGSVYNTSNSNFSSFLNFEDVTKSTNKFAALNLNTPTSKNTVISGYLLFSDSQTTAFNESLMQYLFVDNAFEEQLNEKSFNNNKLAIGKVSFEYKPSLKNELYVNTQVKYNDVGSVNENQSIININETNFIINKNSTDVLLKQDLEWHKKYTSKHTTSFVLNYEYQKSTPKNQWFSDTPFLQGLIPIQEDVNYTISQNRNWQSHKLEFGLKHYWILGAKSQLNTTLGNHYFKENYETNEAQELSDGTINDFETASFGNYLKYTLNDAFIGMHYKFKVGKLVVESGGNFHNYNWRINQNTNVIKNKFSFLPNVTAKYSFYKSEKIHFNYALKNRFGKTNQFINNYTLLNYNSVYKGNPSLEYTNYHTARLLYTKFQLYKNIILSASIGYNKKKETIKNEIIVSGTNKFLTPILFEHPETNWNFRGDIYKRYGKFKIRFTGRFDISDYRQLIDNRLSQITNKSQYYKSSLSTNLEKAPNIKIGYNLKLSDYQSSTLKSNYTTKEPFVEIEYDFLSGFIFKADYYKNTFENKALVQKDSYEFANTSLFYQKEDSAWGFEIRANNLLNINYKRSNNINEFLISDVKTYVLPRVVLFTVSYKL